LSDYTQINDFSAKDALPTGNPEKKIEGSDMDAEFGAISTAILSKYDSDDIATQVEAEALTLNTVLLTPLRLNNVMSMNAGLVKQLNNLGDPGGARVLQYNGSIATYATATEGLELTGVLLRLASTVAGYGLAYSSGVLSLDPTELNTVTSVADADYMLIHDTSTAQPRRILWTDFVSDLSGEGSIGIQPGDTVSALTITNLTTTTTAVNTVNLGQNADTSLTRRGAGVAQVEGRTIATHQNLTYDSCYLWTNSSDPTTQGSEGDFWFTYTP
jgi:hypothetical protein